MMQEQPHNMKEYLTRKLFLSFDVFGFATVLASLFIPHAQLSNIVATLGMTLFTLGITLPVALCYQARQSSESFKIIRACEQAGIRSMFISRSRDRKDLDDAIESASERSAPEIFLLGIAFPNLMNPNEYRSPSIKEKLDSPRVILKVLVLDPDSHAAAERSKIEIGSTTTKDIRATINTNLVSLIETRIKRLETDSCEMATTVLRRCETEKHISVQSIRELEQQVHVTVKVYDCHPIAFIMGFSEDLFTEQYHFGRPSPRVRPKGCIGKYVPVIQYKKDSDGYAFLQNHFEYLWAKSKDITDILFENAIKDYLDEENA